MSGCVNGLHSRFVRWSPRFSREVRRFEMLNAAAQKLYRTAPDPVRKLASRILYSSRAA